DASLRHTYRHMLGRALHPNNSRARNHPQERPPMTAHDRTSLRAIPDSAPIGSLTASEAEGLLHAEVVRLSQATSPHIAIELVNIATRKLGPSVELGRLDEFDGVRLLTRAACEAGAVWYLRQRALRAG